jgi:hypothetical protein
LGRWKSLVIYKDAQRWPIIVEIARDTQRNRWRPQESRSEIVNDRRRI